VTAVSPSQTTQTTTDANGHFIMLSLAPDTYTVSISKGGYQPTSFPGEVVFADQTQQTTYTLSKALKTIAHVTSAAAGNLVKSGVGGDIYSVNSTQAAAAAPLGGGGNLNSAYSAMSTVPGLQVNLGGAGWTFNAAYVRGQEYYNTGFEYDGIPINRAFDNYNASTESSLGLQELQVYTGGGPSSVASSGTSGFVNQVIKTGTYPGYASATLGLGTPSFYHQAQVEIGGATPDRNFSWYAGFSGYNQAFRFLTQDNGAPFLTPNNVYSGPTLGNTLGYFASPTFTGQGVKTSCPVGVSPTTGIPPQGCWIYYSGTSASPSMITDRENVVNLHFGIPKKNGLRDDVQVLWSGSALNNYSESSLANIGTSANQFFWDFDNAPYAPPICGQTITVAAWAGVTSPGCVASKSGAYLPYADQVVYNLPFGTPIAKSASNFIAPSIYKAPDTPAHAYGGGIDPYDNSLQTYENDTGISKLQYTYALSSAAYLRAYGYTFYSDWLQNAPIFGATSEFTPSLPSPQYDLMTHSVGGALDFNDQINDQNLVTADYNYTQAGVIRFNNTSAIAGAGTTPIGYMGNGKCYDAHNGAAVPCLSSSYYDVALKTVVNPRGVYTGASGSCDTGAGTTPCGWVSSAIVGPTGFGNPSATWDSLWNGDVTGSLNTVRPRFQNASISDQFRPNDKFMINASLRYDNFTYVMPDVVGPADAFYADMTANYTCVQAANNQVFTTPLGPGGVPPAPAQYVVGDCNAGVDAMTGINNAKGWVHPNGTKQDGVAAPNFTASSPGSYSIDYWQPRISATFTESPDTVWRVSAGRYAAPPISASVQYLSASGDDRSIWNNTMNLGFYSPFHPIPGITSAQYDLSYERHITGTDMSMKITPYYTWVNDWQQATFIGSNFASQVPVGVNRDYGVEFQFSKGDFNREGLSGLFSFTYTNSKIQFQNVPLSTGGVIPNQTIQLNEAIAQYNALTKAGGGSACYRMGLPVSCSAQPIHVDGDEFDVIENPYYNKPAQGLLDPNGWYNPYVTAIAPNLNGIVDSYISPATATLILNYRHKRLTITPSLQFQAGAWYGSPLDNNGYDPRTCEFSSHHSGIAGAAPHQCDVLSLTAPGLGPLGYLYTPNFQTGSFSAIGSYEAPAILTGNMQLSYDVSPKVKLTVTGTSLFRSCFGGTPEPWTAANPPAPWVCGYGPAGGFLNSSLYAGNFYNGKSIYDAKANSGVVTPWTQSYTPSTSNNGAIGGLVTPWNVFFNAQIKI
jgi:Carboxypeptidase regulatory-like domain